MDNVGGIPGKSVWRELMKVMLDAGMFCITMKLGVLQSQTSYF